MSKRNKKKLEENKVPLIILSNERNPAKADMMTMLYRAFQLGQIGLIDGMDPDTGVVSPMLAGIDFVDGEIRGVYPLARILESTDEISRILIPDGQGSYVNNNAAFGDSDAGESSDGAEEEGGPTDEQVASADGVGAEPT